VEGLHPQDLVVALFVVEHGCCEIFKGRSGRKGTVCLTVHQHKCEVERGIRVVGAHRYPFWPDEEFVGVVVAGDGGLRDASWVVEGGVQVLVLYLVVHNDHTLCEHTCDSHRVVTAYFDSARLARLRLLGTPIHSSPGLLYTEASHV
jgi:hypothetical protein